MEKLNVRFSLSPKELFFINIYSSLKTVIVVFMLGAVLGVISAMLYGFDKVMLAVDWENYYKGIFVLSILVIGAGLIFQLLTDLIAGVKILIYKKSNRAMFDECIISIDEEKGIVLYSDDKKEGVKWGHYKIFFETNKYLVLRDDVNKMFVLKKGVVSADELKWFKQNLKNQNMIEYRKKMEARRNR